MKSKKFLRFGSARYVTELSSVFNIFVQTFSQATVSAIFAVILGFASALGLASVRSFRGLRFFEWLYLTPQVLPVLFILLAFFHIYGLWSSSPHGFFDLILIHVFLSFGFCGVQIHRLFQEKMQGWSNLARVEGASSFQFFKAALPGLRRELAGLWFTVFVFCFLSFSVPLVIGGAKSETLEVYLYKLLLTEGSWTKVIALAVFQIVFLGLIGWRLSSIKRSDQLQVRSSDFISASPFALAVSVFLVLSVVVMGLRTSGQGWSLILGDPVLLEKGVQTLAMSFGVALSAGLSVLFLCCLLCFFWPMARVSKILFSTTTPSVVLIGMVLFLVGWRPSADGLAVCILGLLLAVTHIFALYRFGLREALDSVTKQIQTARTLGASRLQVTHEITLPQLFRHFCFFAGLAALWAVGDFALSLFVLSPDSHLALLTRTLIGRYRLDLASASVSAMLAVGAISFLFFAGLGRVVFRKYN